MDPFMFFSPFFGHVDLAIFSQKVKKSYKILFYLWQKTPKMFLVPPSQKKAVAAPSQAQQRLPPISIWPKPYRNNVTSPFLTTSVPSFLRTTTRYTYTSVGACSDPSSVPSQAPVVSSNIKWPQRDQICNCTS